jgi:uncharacterized membrane protein YccC
LHDVPAFALWQPTIRFKRNIAVIPRTPQTIFASFRKRSRSVSARGTTRFSGADPTRLPTGFDLRAISVIEGLRAGLAAALPVAASVWLHRPDLSLAALGALLTCICDPGGNLRRRLPVLLAFVGVGAMLLGGFGLLRGAGLAPTLVVAAAALFCLGYLRVWGTPMQALGNLLAVVLLLGTDEALPWRVALDATGLFAAGGAWALVLTLVFWRIYPFGPARRSVADVWDSLAAFARMLQRLLAQEEAGAPLTEKGWEAQARAGRGAVRAAIERARDTLMTTADTRGAAGGPAAQNLMRLEAADQVFGVMIALSDHLEYGNAQTWLAGSALLRRLRPLLRVMAEATEREKLARLPRFERAVAGMAVASPVDPALGSIAHALAERLRVALKLIDPAQYLPGSGLQGDAGIPLRQRITGPIAENLTWRSATLRHAVRVSLVVTVALAATLLHQGHYTHWLTITLVLVMQPFFATTWQRTLERVGGTLLGGAVAAGLSAGLHTRLHFAGLLPVLGALALAVRQVSYGVYIAVYTPVVILLVEQIHPLEDQTSIALARAGYTIMGGLIAVAANLVLWPSWQPEQVRRDLAAAIAAHASYARAVLLKTVPDASRERRKAGLSSNNLEASLQRAMHEPRRGQRDRLQAVLVADAALRRIAGRLVAISLDPVEIAGEAAQATCLWLIDTLENIAAEKATQPRPQTSSGIERVERVARQVELLAFTLRKSQRASDVPDTPEPAPAPV